MLSRLTLFTKRIRNSEFIRNSMIMMTGTGLAQIIPILVIPVLTRLYTPGEIGHLATFISLFTIFSIIAAGRYEYAIIMPKSDRQGRQLLHIAAYLSVFTGIALTVAVWIFGDSVSQALQAPSLAPWLWLLPLTVMAQGLFMTFNFGLNRSKQYRHMATGKISQTGSTALIQVLGGLSGWGIAGLIIGKTAGVVLSAFWLMLSLLRKAPEFFRNDYIPELKKTAADFKNYPKFNAPHAFVTNLSSNMPVLLFITFFSDAIAGFYAMAFRACYAPVQIVSTAIGQVFGKRLAEKKHEDADVRSYVIKVLLHFAAIGLIPFGLLFLAGPTVFGLILGAEWAVTGVYIRILAPYVYMTFITQPFSYIPLLYNRQKTAFGIFIVSLILRMLGLFTGIWMDIFYVSLSLYSGTGVAVLVYHIYWYLSLCQTGSQATHKEERDQ